MTHMYQQIIALPYLCIVLLYFVLPQKLKKAFWEKSLGRNMQVGAANVFVPQKTVCVPRGDSVLRFQEANVPKALVRPLLVSPATRITTLNSAAFASFPTFIIQRLRT